MISAKTAKLRVKPHLQQPANGKKPNQKAYATRCNMRFSQNCIAVLIGNFLPTFHQSLLHLSAF